MISKFHIRSGSFVAVFGLMACNLLSVVMAKVVAEHFSTVISFLATFLLLLYVGIWGMTYLIRLVLWLIVGKRYQLSFIYPIMELNYFFSYLIGILCWKENFSWQQIVGLSLICLGVLAITSSPHRLSSGTEVRENG